MKILKAKSVCQDGNYKNVYRAWRINRIGHEELLGMQCPSCGYSVGEYSKFLIHKGLLPLDHPYDWETEIRIEFRSWWEKNRTSVPMGVEVK